MAQVVIALGSNLNDPHQQLKQAGEFLESISEGPVIKSPIYKSEPLGPSKQDFLNAVAVIQTSQNADTLLAELKKQEQKQGRPSRYPKWTARTLDLDIIAWDHLVVETDSLIIPHQEYSKRLFVLLPLKDVFPDWKDPVSARMIDDMIEQAPNLDIDQTMLNW